MFNLKIFIERYSEKFGKSSMLFFTLIYLICEIIYNLGFVEFISSPNTELSVYNRLEFFGKALASIGLSLVLVKFFKKYALLFFIAIVPTFFIFQTFAFEQIVRGLPEDIKLNAYLAGVYRNASLNKTIDDERITNSSSYNKVLVSNIALIGESGKHKSEVDKIFNVSVNSELINDYYENYNSLNSKIYSYWYVYRIEDKKWSNYPANVQEKIDAEFLKRSDGIPRGLSKQEFLLRVAEKSPSFRTYQDMVVVPGNKTFGIEEVKGRDIPMGMSKEEFTQFFNKKTEDAVEKTALTSSNVENLPHVNDLVSSVVIPPIALSLSFMSIVLNASVLLMTLKRLLVVIPALMVAGVFATYEHNPYGLPAALNKALGVEASLHTALKPLASLIRYVSINDDNPNEMEIVRIKKPDPIDFSDIEGKFAQLSSESVEGLPDVPTNIVADEERLENDQTYFGEIKGKSNINPYTGQPY